MPIREDLLKPLPGEEEEALTRKTALWAVMDVVGDGDVLLVAADGDRETGCLGEMLITYLEVRGASGLIVDGCIRDWPQVQALDLPVWTTGLTPNHARQGTKFPWAYNVPVACGGVFVHPGDIVVADDDGAVIIPRAMAGEVAAGAREKERTEEFSRQRLRGGGQLQTYYPLDEAGRSEFEQWRAGSSRS